MPQSLGPTEYPSDSYSNRGQSLTYFQPPFLSPIMEASSPELSFLSSNINLHRSSAIRRSSNPESTSSYISPAESSNTGPSAPSTYFNRHHRTVSPGPDFSNSLGSDDDFYAKNTTNGQYHGSAAAASDASIASFYHNSPVQRPVPRHPVKLISPHLTDPTANGQYHGPAAAESDASSASFYRNSPVQRPVQRHPVKFIPLHSTDPTANWEYHGLAAAESDASSASFYRNSPIQRPVQRHPVKFKPLHSTDPAAFYAGPVRGAYSTRTNTQSRVL